MSSPVAIEWKYQGSKAPANLIRPDRPLIGLAGKMHSGKSTIADTLNEERDWNIRYFAHPVKWMAVQMVNTMWAGVSQKIGLSWDSLTLRDLEQDKDRFRSLYQFVGAYGRHAFGEDIWIRMFKANVQRDGRWPDRLVVADVRYPNEAQFLLEQGFSVYLVKRPEKERIASVTASFEARHHRKPKRKELKSMLTHESETGVDAIEGVGLYLDIIKNERDVDWLQTLARSLD